VAARKSRSSTIIVVPTFNEAQSLPKLIEKLIATDFHVLIVDDNSPDGTGEIAKNYARDNERISVLHRQGKEGLGEAYRAGFKNCIERDYSWIVEMDADGSHRIEDLFKLTDYVYSHPQTDLLIGSRWIVGGMSIGWSLPRKLLSQTANKVVKALLHSQLSDLTSGFRILSRAAALELILSQISAKGYGFQIESAILLEKSGFRVVQEPITFVERAEGESKMSPQIILEAILLLMRLFFTHRKQLPTSTS